MRKRRSAWTARAEWLARLAFDATIAPPVMKRMRTRQSAWSARRANLATRARRGTNPDAASASRAISPLHLSKPVDAWRAYLWALGTQARQASCAKSAQRARSQTTTRLVANFVKKEQSAQAPRPRCPTLYASSARMASRPGLGSRVKCAAPTSKGATVCATRVQTASSRVWPIRRASDVLWDTRASMGAAIAAMTQRLRART